MQVSAIKYKKDKMDEVDLMDEMDIISHCPFRPLSPLRPFKLSFPKKKAWRRPTLPHSCVQYHRR